MFSRVSEAYQLAAWTGLFVGGPSEVMNSMRGAFGWHYERSRFALQIADLERYNTAWQKIFNYASDVHECLSKDVCLRSRDDEQSE